ncbi:MAG: glycoside hydrolase [Candidatus Bathyarchaeia archaeon]
MIKIGETERIEVSVDEKSGCLEVLDKNARYAWKQILIDGYVFKEAKQIPNGLEIYADFIRNDEGGVNVPFKIRYTMGELPSDICIEVETDLERPIGDVYYPYPFVLDDADGFLVIPRNNGIIYPVRDLSVHDEYLRVYGGIHMPWFGAINLKKGYGYMGIFETPFDAGITIMKVPYKVRENLINVVFPIWHPSKGRFAYVRRILYYFSSEGGYVALAKRYRKYAIKIGRFKSLKDKLKDNPDVDKLIGAANFWPIGYGFEKITEEDRVRMAKTFYDLGVKKLLFSQINDPESIEEIKKLGYLVSRYDQYDDVYPPNVSQILGWSGDSNVKFPEDCAKLPNGFLMKAWQPRTPKGILQGYKICPSRGYERAKERILNELKTKKYNTRFIDIVTADYLHECYDKCHPLTRQEWMEFRLKILKLCYDYPLIVGAENGMDWAVPYVHYFEGMAGVGYRYLLPACGHFLREYIPPHEEYLKYAVGEYYRVPLWELVYHDAVVSTWYWGDSNNRIPELWNKKDLFNVLYGTMPMYLVGKEEFEVMKYAIVRSYKYICPIIEKVGYAEMISHSFLTDDHKVQRTVFQTEEKRIIITVNFGTQAYLTPEGEIVRPMDYIVREESL